MTTTEKDELRRLCAAWLRDELNTPNCELINESRMAWLAQKALDELDAATDIGTGTVPRSSVNIEAVCFESDDGQWIATVSYTDATSETIPFREACRKLG